MAVLLGTLVAVSTSATAQATLSPGCQVANDPAFDSTYGAGGIAGFEFFAGETITATGVASEPGTLSLEVGGTIVDTATSSDTPGTVSYTFPATTTSTVMWEHSQLRTTWTVSCTPPPAYPVSKDQCKNGGWQTFNNPGFKNQGDCVSFVATRGRNPAAG